MWPWKFVLGASLAFDAPLIPGTQVRFQPASLPRGTVSLSVIKCFKVCIIDPLQ